MQQYKHNMKYNINIDGHIGPWGFSQSFIRQQLSALADKPVTVRLNSLGGMVSHALDIRQQFIDHGDVTCYLYGYVASAATILTTGAKKVCMSKYAFYLVHKVSNWVDAWGQYNADQIQQIINELIKNKEENDKMDLVLASLYANKCKKPVKDILNLLKEGKWMTAEEAKQYGFIDEIVDDGDKINFDEGMKQKFNMFGLPPAPTSTSLDMRSSFEQQLAKEPQEHVSWFRNFCDRMKARKNYETDNTNIKRMNKDYTKLNASLGIEGIDVDKEGNATLSASQLKALDDLLGDLMGKITERDNTITDLKNQIQNLNDGDGDDSHKITDGDGDSAKTVDDMYNMVKDLI